MVSISGMRAVPDSDEGASDTDVLSPHPVSTLVGWALHDMARS
jgi:hypothetical protein